MNIASITSEKSSSSVAFKAYFPLRKFSGIPCPSCGIPMLANKDMLVFITDATQTRGLELRKVLYSGRGYYRPIEDKFAQTAYRALPDHPHANLNDITEILAQTYLPRLEKKQEKVLREMLDNMKRLTKQDRDAVNSFLKGILWIIFKRNPQNPFSRQRFLEHFESVSQNATSNGNFARLQKIAEKMPTSLDSVEAFIVKNARQIQKDRETNAEKKLNMASKIISPSLATIEHMLTKIKVENNNIDNFLLMCEQCNTSRKTTSYKHWLTTHPEMPENLRLYAEYVSSLIRRHKDRALQDMETYLADANETLKRVSKGKLRLLD